MNEMELANRADLLTEAGSLEDDIDPERRDEVTNDDPSCGARTVPKRERFIRPQVRDEQTHRDPFRTQSARPAKAGSHELSR